MPTYANLVLTLSFGAVFGAVFPAVFSSGTLSRREQGQCYTWGGNATTTVFYNCCKQVTLMTYPRLALTALCPNRISDFDTSQFPNGQYTFSWLPLGECLHLHNGALVTMDDVTPQEAMELEDMDSACDQASFTFIEDPPQIRGTCASKSVVYPLDYFILSSRGVLVCGGSSRGVASASLDDTCCNFTLNTHAANNPTAQNTTDDNDLELSAMCQTHRFRQPGFHNLDNTEEWRVTNISLISCQARQPGADLLGPTEGCTKTLVDDNKPVLSTTCGAGTTKDLNLADFIRNEYGRLACYDLRGT